MITLFAALALLASGPSASYVCTLDVPAALTHNGNDAALHPIRFPGVAGGAWKFHLAVTHGEDVTSVELSWPEDPIQIAGKYPALSTSEGSVAFTAHSAGPCMFTEAGCITLVNLVDFGDGTAKVVVTPSAITTDPAKNNKRVPFEVIIEGSCTRTDKPK
jgi:hypothetical protein